MCSYTPLSRHHFCMSGSFTTEFARISNVVCGNRTVDPYALSFFFSLPLPPSPSPLPARTTTDNPRAGAPNAGAVVPARRRDAARTSAHRGRIVPAHDDDDDDEDDDDLAVVIAPRIVVCNAIARRMYARARVTSSLLWTRKPSRSRDSCTNRDSRRRVTRTRDPGAGCLDFEIDRSRSISIDIDRSRGSDGV